LLLVATAVGVVLAYEKSWIQQRHAFIAEQLERHKAAWDGDVEGARTIQWWKDQLNSDKCAPGLLCMFGEAAVRELFVLIPEQDIVRRQRGTPDELYSQLEMRPSQPDYLRARRLFPEANVTPMKWADHVPRESARAFYEITLSDE
jgi:hypothetical protein